MTQTQRYLSWTLFGLAILLVSLCMWNKAFKRFVAIRRPTHRYELQEKKLRLAGSLLPVVKEGTTEEPHEAAPEEPLPQEPTELDQWDLRQMYSITIPSIGVRAPVFLPPMTHWDNRDWDLLEQQMQVGLTYGAVAYPHSSTPSGDGTLIVAGHSSPPTERARQSAYGDLFARLPELKEGDIIRIGYGSQTYEYEMVASRIVPASDTSILVKDDEPLLKIITCFPIGTSKDRLVLTARRVD